MNSLAARRESRPTEPWFLRVHPRLNAAPPRRMRLRYGSGFVEGKGEWRLEPGSGGTRVVYDLNVVAKGQLVTLIGRLLPLGRMHSRLMRDILQKLEREVSQRQSAQPARKAGG